MMYTTYEKMEDWMRYAVYIFVCLILTACALGAGIETHFKKLGKKPEGHNMPNVDYIYMINLDRRPEKWILSTEQLWPYGIYPYRFSGIDGWQLSLEVINDIGLKYESWMEGGFMGTCYNLEDNFHPTHEIIGTVGKTYFRHKMGRGRFGVILSHLSVLQDAWDSGYDTIWVMEDDIEVVKDPAIICDLIDDLDNEVGKGQWDILFTDRDLRGKDGFYNTFRGILIRPDYNPEDKSRFYIDKKISPDFWRVGARWGAHSMIIRRSGMEKILNFFKTHQIFDSFDMTYHLPENMKFYTVDENVVTNLIDRISDNRDCP